MLYQAPRGTSDILPQEQAYWRYLEQMVAHTAQLYGYQRLDAPLPAASARTPTSSPRRCTPSRTGGAAGSP
jgi:hypothetical protein